MSGEAKTNPIQVPETEIDDIKKAARHWWLRDELWTFPGTSQTTLLGDKSVQLPGWHYLDRGLRALGPLQGRTQKRLSPKMPEADKWGLMDT